jgi:hypothetical protein
VQGYHPAGGVDFFRCKAIDIAGLAATIGGIDNYYMFHTIAYQHHYIGTGAGIDYLYLRHILLFHHVLDGMYAYALVTEQYIADADNSDSGIVQNHSFFYRY